MRTFVKTTPPEPLYSSAMVIPPLALVRPHMVRGQPRAIRRPLQRRPMAAMLQHLQLSPLYFIGKRPRRAGRRDGIFIAGDNQGRATEKAQVRGLGPCKRLAGLRKTFRLLAHIAFAQEG